MKQYKIIIYIDDIKKVYFVEALTYEDAIRLAWERYDADDIYVSEVDN